MALAWAIHLRFPPVPLAPRAPRSLTAPVRGPAACALCDRSAASGPNLADKLLTTPVRLLEWARTEDWGRMWRGGASDTPSLLLREDQ